MRLTNNSLPHFKWTKNWCWNLIKFSRAYSVQNKIDPQQEALLDEPCILIDSKDKVTGFASKKSCHLLGKDGSSCPLHRAFSVFIFNANNELLLQQRSDKKITFPGYYTNTCCSHPLYTASELVEKDAWGVKVAAQRRLNFELGIPLKQVLPEDFTYLTRILYASPSNGIWGEHEIDYVLFLKGNFDVNPNENEVKDVKYIKRENFNEFLEELSDSNIHLTPWFKLIAQSFLPLWWQDLDSIKSHEDHSTIHNMLS